MRDRLARDLLRRPADRVALPQNSSRIAKFGELLIHRIDDVSYPDLEDRPGISGWFKVEILDFYHAGIDVILSLETVLFDGETRNWSLLSPKQGQASFPEGFWKARVWVTGRIPWRNILYYDLNGDNHYRCPHIYCAFADDGEPYEARGYFMLGQGYEYELNRGDKLEIDALLMQATSKALSSQYRLV